MWQMQNRPRWATLSGSSQCWQVVFPRKVGQSWKPIELQSLKQTLCCIMSHKLLNGNFSASSFQQLVSKVTETEKDEGNWEAQPCPEGPSEKLLKTQRATAAQLLTVSTLRGH